MVLLEYDNFLSRLTLMFDRSRGKDQHVDITMKRYDGKTKPEPRPEAAPAKGKAKGGATKGKPTSAAGASSAAAAAKARLESTGAETEYMCLIRASYKGPGKGKDNKGRDIPGKGKEKISLIVPARDVNKFQVAYCNLLKSHMDGLKKHKKVKAKKNLQ